MIRAGVGFDAHASDAARPLVLGGVVVPGAPGLAGHSDADVVSHAVADALLGAAGLGDLGSNFPATDRWRDASSLEILSETARRLGGAGWSIANIDVTVVAEAPRLTTFIDDMRGSVSAALGIEVGMVSVKATTTDSLGSVGRREGIAALAVALIEGSGPADKVTR